MRKPDITREDAQGYHHWKENLTTLLAGGKPLFGSEEKYLCFIPPPHTHTQTQRHTDTHTDTQTHT